MLIALLVVPVVSGLAAFWLHRDRLRRALLVGAALVHVRLTARAWEVRPEPSLGGWLALDPIGLLFLSVISILFLAAAIYGVGYLARERHARQFDTEERLFFSNEPEAIFTGCLLLFLASMTLVTVSQHLGLLWVGIEATTLASAPLIYFHRHHRSLEATWKYLLICSVGIALALLGNFLMAVAASDRGETPTSLTLADLVRSSTQLHTPWVAAAFLFFLVGYGTKMGLAPLHTWLPDAHSESPSVVSALLSGALLNCAFLGILRAHQVCAAAGIARFSQELLLAFGLLSMAIAAVFILGQSDFKRMLAYSSVEHMGILSLGVGLGGAGAFGMALHALNHSLTKAGLFMVAGNILAAYGTKSVVDVRGLGRRLPLSGVLWVAGFLAITGSPPFGSFLSELTILKAALDHGQAIVAVSYLAVLAAIFIGMGNLVLPMAQGSTADRAEKQRDHEALWSTLPPAALVSLTFLLGVYVPPNVSGVLHEVARSLGGQ
jgi:hydrogenase-4 component F